MSTVLYRKYRPQTFADVTNQQAIVRTLTNELRSNRLAHAYCFSGPRGVGKTSIARLLARAANCTRRGSGSPEPCNECEQCQAMIRGQSLDLIEIDAASNTGVDNVRDNIIAASRVATAGGKKKVFIIDEAHMLSLSAFNALLKTLEEPPEHVLFILATTELHKLPATILSRCQRFHFGRIARADMIERLQRIAVGEGRLVDRAVLEAISDQAEGSLRDAETLFGQVLSLEGGDCVTMETAQLVLGQTVESEVCALARALADADAPAAMTVLDRFQDDGGNALRLFDAMIELLRQSLYVSQKLDDSPVVVNLDTARRDAATLIAQKKGTVGIVGILDRYLRRRAMVSSVNDPMLPLVMASAESALDIPTPELSVAQAFVQELNG